MLECQNDRLKFLQNIQENWPIEFSENKCQKWPIGLWLVLLNTTQFLVVSWCCTDLPVGQKISKCFKNDFLIFESNFLFSDFIEKILLGRFCFVLLPGTDIYGIKCNDLYEWNFGPGPFKMQIHIWGSPGVRGGLKIPKISQNL